MPWKACNPKQRLMSTSVSIEKPRAETLSQHPNRSRALPTLTVPQRCLQQPEYGGFCAAKDHFEDYKAQNCYLFTTSSPTGADTQNLSTIFKPVCNLLEVFYSINPRQPIRQRHRLPRGWFTGLPRHSDRTGAHRRACGMVWDMSRPGVRHLPMPAIGRSRTEISLYLSYGFFLNATV